MNKNRLGRFILGRRDLNQWESRIMPIMGNFVIVESRWRHDIDATEYLAYSPLFDVIDPNCEAPSYEITIAEFPDAPAVIGARRKDQFCTVPKVRFRDEMAA